jgi:hypothetical protein
VQIRWSDKPAMSKEKTDGETGTRTRDTTIFSRVTLLAESGELPGTSGFTSARETSVVVTVFTIFPPLLGQRFVPLAQTAAPRRR